MGELWDALNENFGEKRLWYNGVRLYSNTMVSLWFEMPYDTFVIHMLHKWLFHRVFAKSHRHISFCWCELLNGWCIKMYWTPAKMLLLADVDEYSFSNAVIHIVSVFLRTVIRVKSSFALICSDNQISSCFILQTFCEGKLLPDSKVHGANTGPTWVLLAPDGPMLAPYTLLSGLVTGAFPMKRSSNAGISWLLCCLSEQHLKQTAEYHWFGMPWNSCDIIVIFNSLPPVNTAIFGVCVCGLIEYTDRSSYEDWFSQHSADDKKLIPWNNIKYSEIMIFAHFATHSTLLVLQIIMFKINASESKVVFVPKFS